MKRLTAIAILLAAAPLPGWCQRHGGGGSSFHSGATSSASAHSGSFGSVPRPPGGSSSTPYRGSYNFGTRSYGGSYGHGYPQPYGTICRSGYGCRTTYNYHSSPYYYGGYPYVWYPFYGGDSGYSPNNADYDNQQGALADEQRRNSELAAALADAQERDSYPPPDSGSRSEPSGARDDRPNTVLVFSNGTHAEIQNYAIMGDTLYDFSPQRTRKILLSQLDIYATIKANDDRGIEFRVPPRQQSQ